MAACGRDFTVAVTEDGELLACGQGDHGQLGLGAVLHQQQPARAGGPERERVLFIGTQFSILYTFMYSPA